VFLVLVFLVFFHIIFNDVNQYDAVKVVAEVHNVLNFDLVQGTAIYAEPGYFTCGYTKDTSTGLAAMAFVFLLFGQVLGCGTHKPGWLWTSTILIAKEAFNSVCFIVLSSLIIFWKYHFFTCIENMWDFP
jgi:hypothetical protein